MGKRSKLTSAEEHVKRPRTGKRCKRVKRRRTGKPSKRTLAAKSERTLAPKSTMGATKIGFLCYSADHSPKGKYSELQIFSVDLDAGGGDYTTQLRPAIRIYGFRKKRRNSAMCVSNSTLYIFEGRNYREDLNVAEGGRSVWKLGLSSEILGKVEPNDIVLDDLARVRDMHLPKCCPVAFPVSTANGHKILVVSDRFDNHDARDVMELYEDVMELYDPSNDEWEILPKFPIALHFYPKAVEMYSCNPLGDSGLMVHTSEGMFVMDLNSVNKAWKHAGFNTLSGYRTDFAWINDRYLISPGWLCDLKGVDDDKEVECDFSTFDRSIQTEDYGVGLPCMFLVQGGSGSVCCTLVSQTQLLFRDYPHRLLIDVCCAGFNPLRINVVRTLRFGFEAFNPGYIRHALFQI